MGTTASGIIVNAKLLPFAIMNFRSIVAALVLSTSVAYNLPSSRREVFQKAAVGLAFLPSVVHAVDACPPKSNNCIVTTWTPPSGTSKADAAKAMKAILTGYPQEGQNKADLGGWTIVSDDLSGSGAAKVEYKSGIGNFAKFLNGGKPFVDDLVVEIKSDSSVALRSSSRVGDSDFGVNQKRLQYMGEAAKAMGWTVPEPKY